ncbi:DUF4124 domain-containing protein [Pseudomonas sp. 5P_3.1_Bac2]|uniref:DUF4124 domain-containing protein n=1 Tax=Pseudomonas sp. 5P_3.1_Bac2 TaxID=2971617 RepID=UPI0021C86A95|nr:DUF4124 domain-containing protein [Pseudomonas sp. 5P_3.1_Bac2]MCU1717906.1 DUF4124 domain-containing protein [Pseudomonas sp. 5P_3.1_Bac2]
MRLLTACLLCFLSLSASAQIYKYTDAKGNTVFTDQPPQGTAAKSIDLAPINSLPMATPAPSASATEDPSASHEQPYKTLALTGLPNAEALRANNGSFAVSVEIAPRLAQGHLLRLLVDGKPYGQATTQLSLPVSHLDRGEHSLAVEVLNGEQVIQQSLTQTLTVQRVNTQSPALRPPPPTPR